MLDSSKSFSNCNHLDCDTKSNPSRSAAELRAKLDAAKPPYSDTGVNLPNGVCVGFDWLTATFDDDGRRHIAIANVVRRHFGDNLDYKKAPDGAFVGTQWYRFLMTGSTGVSIGLSNRAKPVESSKQHGSIKLPGSALARLTFNQVHHLFCDLESYGVRPSRMDLRLDDYRKRITPAKVLAAAENGFVVGFRRCSVAGEGFIGEGLGAYSLTAYLGRRGSKGGGKLARCYRKDLQTDGEIDANRLEVEFSGDKALECWNTILSCDKDMWPDLIRSYISSAVDFRDRTPPPGVKANKQRIDKSPRLSWWSEIIEDVDKIPFAPRVIRKTFDRTLKWFENQVVPSFALLMSAFSIDSGAGGAEAQFWQWWADGEKRFEDLHHQILHNYALSLGLRYKEPPKPVFQ